MGTKQEYSYIKHKNLPLVIAILNIAGSWSLGSLSNLNHKQTVSGFAGMQWKIADAKLFIDIDGLTNAN